MTSTRDPAAWPARHARAFPDLAPPPGGLARLRDRLAAPRRRARALTLAFVPALLVAALATLVLVAVPARARLPDHPALAAPTGMPGARGGVVVRLGPGVTLAWVP